MELQIMGERFKFGGESLAATYKAVVSYRYYFKLTYPIWSVGERFRILHADS